MKSFKNFVCVLAVIVMAMLLIGAINPEKASAYRKYTIRPGDTLWSISKEITPSSRDLRYTVRDIEKKNGIENSVIRVGQDIFIPVYEEE